MISMPPKDLSQSSGDEFRSMVPEECYEDVNQSSIDDHIDSLAGNNLLRADARARIYRALFPFEPHSIADIGCGVGLTAAALKRTYPQADVFGYDISENAIAYASRNDKDGVQFRAVTAGPDVILERAFGALVFQEFYPFTRTGNFVVHEDFLQFIVKNLSAGGLAFIQLAVRHPERTILNNIPQLEAFCRQNDFALSQHMIPFDRLVDITGSVSLSALLTPALAIATGADRRVVLMLRRIEKKTPGAAVAANQ
jgi:SAM-dependent methyltransferase